MGFARSTGVALLAGALLLGACSSSSDDAATTEWPDGATGPDVQLTVTPDRDAPVFVANITFTEVGIEPETLFLPAGHQIRLVLRNRTEHERHFRVPNLDAIEVRWIEFPEVDTYDLDSMAPEDLEALGVDMSVTDEAEMEHILHHLAANFVPTKEASLHGIKPVPGEVHGYTQRGEADTMIFTPLRTGRYEVVDDLNPQFTGTVVVFLPPGANGV